MSDKKAPLGGLFVNKKASAAPAAAPTNAKPKNVKQRWMMIGVAMLGFIVVSSSFFSKSRNPQQTAPVEKPGMVLVAPRDADKAALGAALSDDMRRIQNDNEKLQAEVGNMQKQMLKLKEDAERAAREPKKVEPALPSTIVPPPVQGQGKTAQPTAANIPPPPPIPPNSPTGGQTRVGTPTAVDVPSFGSGQVVLQDAQVFKPEAKPVQASAAADAEGVKASSKYKKNAYSGFLPAGAFAPVVLLNGLDAGTSTTTQANPMPVLMNITDQATLPGSAKYSVKSCFVLGTGYGDMSAERVYVRYSRLSCVDKENRLVLSADVSGYLVDSDGKIGLRGKVVDRQGAKLGKAMLAGFAQGLTGALGQAQSTVTSSALGSTTSIGGGDALRASGLGGAQSATQQLAQFYLKEAQAMFPVISIDTGRTGTIVFTDSASLAWSTGDSQYVKETKPD